VVALETTRLNIDEWWMSLRSAIQKIRMKEFLNYSALKNSHNRVG